MVPPVGLADVRRREAHAESQVLLVAERLLDGEAAPVELHDLGRLAVGQYRREAPRLLHARCAHSDQLISTTRSQRHAENWARSSGTAVSVIDETRLPADGVLDLSTNPGRTAHLGDPSGALPGSELHTANRLVRGAEEVLVTGHIPADAILDEYVPAPRPFRTPPTDPTSGDGGACT